MFVQQFNPDDLSGPLSSWNSLIANTSDAQGIAYTADGRLYVMTRSNNTDNSLIGSSVKIVQDITAFCCNITAFQLPVTPVTAIRTISNDARVNGFYYNLSGQRMEHPAKGIYIRNGKKIVVK